MWCFLTTLNGIEFRRIESIRREGEDIVIQSAGTKGLTERESHVHKVGDIAGNLVSSLSKALEERRERERKKRNRGGGYSWDLSDSPTRSLRSGGGRRNTLDAKMCKLRELIIPRVVRELVKSRSSMNVGGNSG